MTVFEAARQVDCIQAAERLGLPLKRSGSRRFTRCLFHAENTPSMCLYPDEEAFTASAAGAWRCDSSVPAGIER